MHDVAVQKRSFEHALDATTTCACRWLGGAYWMLITMLSVGYGDITPRTNTEIILTMFACIAGIVFFGILLGSIAEALTVSFSPFL